MSDPAYDVREFLIESIKDIQGTIRAVDLKANTLLLTIGVVLANADRTYKIVQGLHDKVSGREWGILCVFVILPFVCTLGLSLRLAFAALAGRSHPLESIPDKGRASGSFYSHTSDRYNFWDLVFRGDTGREQYLEAHQNKLPKNRADETLSLAFEQLKVAIIRDLKIARVNGAIKYAQVAIVFGFILILIAWLHGVSLT